MIAVAEDCAVKGEARSRAALRAPLTAQRDGRGTATQ